MLHTDQNPRPRSTVRPVGFLTYPARSVINLRPPGDRPTASFLDVLDNRRTRYADECLNVDQLSELLWHGGRVRERFDDSSSHRAAPSAGGIHPIEILVHGLSDATGLFHYDAEKHRLIEVAHDLTIADELVTEADSCLPCRPATLLWFLAVTQRTDAKYTNADTLVLRDTGALITTLCLCGTALKFQPVPLGTRGEPMLSRLTTWSVPVTGVGGMHISGR